MKIIIKFIIPALLSSLIWTSCTQSYKPGKNIATVPGDTIKVTETEALMRFISNSGDYINSGKAPSLVSAEDVYLNLPEYHIIDLRTKEDYVNGHISGAVKLQMNELMNHLDKNIAPSIYKKVVLVCKNGQSSAFASSVLRLIGYSNVYSMSYGMSSWNTSLNKWKSKISSEYVNKLEQKTNPVEGMHPYPELNTGEKCGAEILQARGETLLNTPFQKLKISADRIFRNPNDFYVICYMPKDRYDVGHIPGAYQYTPGKDINSKELLNTIPSDKKVLVYGYTGQSSAFVVAYLRLLGYNAFTMPFGANSFMFNTLKLRNWNAFISKDKVNDFPLVKGENPTDKAFEKELNQISKKAEPKKPLARRKKKEVVGGCS